MLVALQGLLEYFRDERHRGEDLASKAIAAILDALNETELYLQRLEKAGATNRPIEEMLSRKWTSAAAAVRRVDRDLAERCLHKGRYWVEPDRFTDSYVLDNRIGIRQMREDIESLFHRTA